MSVLYSIREVKMKIDGFKQFTPPGFTQGTNKIGGSEGFSNTLNELINDVNQAQADSQKAVQGFVGGEGVELHDVMIAGEKAKTSLELLMEIRNKTVDMFKELTRMPV
jgi:flagellar hook-basal body complex protein FliE